MNNLRIYTEVACVWNLRDFQGSLPNSSILNHELQTQGEIVSKIKMNTHTIKIAVEDYT